MMGMGPKQVASYGLVVALLLFGFQWALEIAGPIESSPHLPHHSHSGTVYHATLPCDVDNHTVHFCVHSQKWAPAVYFCLGFSRDDVHRASGILPYAIVTLPFSFLSVRAPPLS